MNEAVATRSPPAVQRDATAGLCRCKTPLPATNPGRIVIAMRLVMRSLAALCLMTAIMPSSARPAPPVYELEHPGVRGAATGYFHLERLGKRWWFIAPDGNGFFPRAVALLDFSSSGAAGTGFRAYDAVALTSKGSPAYRTVTAEAEDTNPADVLMAGRPYTVRNAGDAIVIGSSRFQPEFTKFQMSVVGSGGAIDWYYRSNSRSRCAPPPCWLPVNRDGRPYSAAARDASRSFALDTVADDYQSRAVDAAGFITAISRPAPVAIEHGVSAAPHSVAAGANRVQWWNWSVDCPRNGSCTWPPDFARLIIRGIDSTPRYYLEGVVGKAFTVAPVLSQIAEEASQDELLKARYGGSTVNTARIKWLNNDLPKLEAAGINAAGQYSYAAYLLELGLHNGGKPYTGDGGIGVGKPIPLEYIMTPDDWAMRNAETFKPALAASPIKNIYANVKSTFCGGYEGRTPDVFDPHYYRTIANALEFGAGGGAWSGNGNRVPDASRIYAVVSEEADDLFGVDARRHEHLGAAVLMANPYMAADPRYSVVYRDPILYSKLALRDMLKDEYKTITALNAAWGTAYTSWDTSAGAIAIGTNSYGAGSGFLDEDGRHVIADCRHDDYRHPFASRPAILSDLDRFVFGWSERYAQVLRKAWNTLSDAGPLPPLFVPLYSGVDEAYRAMSPYVDGFWINPGEAAAEDGSSFASGGTQTDLRRIVRDTDKPLIVADYLSDYGGDLKFDGLASAAVFNPASHSTTITVNDAPYWFGAPIDLQFSGGRCANATLKPVAVDWNQASKRTQLVVAGNFASCLTPDSRVRIRRSRGGGVFDDAAARANASVARFDCVVNFAGRKDGVRQVVGLELWDLYPEALVSRGAPQGFGLMTDADNPRDGIADTTTAGVDREGYPAGGEQRRWGNLLRGPASLGGYLAGIDAQLR